MNSEPAIALACRIYRAGLLLYPGEHRSAFGRDMEQLFRDQCRAAVREAGSGALVFLGLRTLGDLLLSAFREHASQRIQLMKTISPSRIALILLITAIATLQFAAASATHSAVMTTIWLTVSAVALLGRGVAEIYRPKSEWVRGLVWGFGVALLYSLIFPAWKHYSDDIGLASLQWIKFSTFGLMLNFVVPIVKAFPVLVRRRVA